MPCREFIRLLKRRLYVMPFVLLRRTWSSLLYGAVMVVEFLISISPEYSLHPIHLTTACRYTSNVWVLSLSGSACRRWVSCHVISTLAV